MVKIGCMLILKAQIMGFDSLNAMQKTSEFFSIVLTTKNYQPKRLIPFILTLLIMRFKNATNLQSHIFRSYTYKQQLISVKLLTANKYKNKPAAQATDADPYGCNSTNRQNPPFQQNRRHFLTNDVILISFDIQIVLREAIIFYSILFII